MSGLLLLFYIFLLVLCVQFYIYLFIYKKWNDHKEVKGSFSSPVTIVVCGFNEAENWKKLVPLLLEQKYLDFQLVVVNDQSNDNSLDILKQWEDHPKLKLVNIEDHVQKTTLGKKFALTLGIKVAEHEHLLLTDADCYPKDENWISSMVQHFSDEKQIVLGYGGHEKRKGLFNKLLRFDTFQIAVQYFSFSLIGKTYMGVGRNLAYRKSIFFENKGFASHLHLPSGDDDLFIAEVATSKNTVISSSHSAQTLSPPKITFASWVKQKTRHISTSGHYSFEHKFLLGLITLIQLMFWGLFIFLLATSVWQWALLLFGLKFVVQTIIYYPLLKKTDEVELIYLLPFLELLHLLSNMLFFVFKSFKKKLHW